MKKLLKSMKEWIYGRRAESLGPIKPGYTTTCQGPYTNFGDWCEEFRVSMMYDRKSLHLN